MNIRKSLLCLMVLALPSVGLASKQLFKSQEELDTAVAETARETYKKINAKWSYPAEGEPGKSASKYWEFSYLNGIGSLKMAYDLPSVCIKDILESETLIDCRLSQDLLKLNCLRELLGDQAFDLYIIGYRQSSKQIVLGGQPELDPCMVCFTFYDNTPIYENPKVGHFGHIPNSEFYMMLHENRLGAGENVFVVSGPTDVPSFMGFGKQYGSEGLTGEEVKASLRREMFEEKANTKAFIPYADVLQRIWMRSKSLHDQSFAEAQKGQMSASFNLERVNQIINRFKLK